MLDRRHQGGRRAARGSGVVDLCDPDGWALSTVAGSAGDSVLALCPVGVRGVIVAARQWGRHSKSKRPISAWEPLIVCGGREAFRPTALGRVREALAYGARYRRFPGALEGLKPPQFVAWMFAQLGARAGR